MRQFLTRVSPLRALRDLRLFFGVNHRHRLGFLAVAAVLTGCVIAAFVHDSHFEREYTRKIVYFESWPANRSDDEIRAQQAIDLPKEQAEKARVEEFEAKRRASFKRLDDKLEKWGF